jgi:hypothetical protein
MIMILLVIMKPIKVNFLTKNILAFVKQLKMKVDGLELVLLTFIINLRIRAVKELKPQLNGVELDKVINDFILNEINLSVNYVTVEGIIEHASNIQQEFKFFK